MGVKKRDIETRGSCGRIPKRTDQSGTTDEESSSVVGGSLSKSIERLFKYIVIIIINPRVDGDRKSRGTGQKEQVKSARIRELGRWSEGGARSKHCRYEFPKCISCV